MNSCFGLCGNVILTKCNKLKLKISYLNKKAKPSTKEDANNNERNTIYESIVSVEAFLDSNESHRAAVFAAGRPLRSLDIIPSKNGILDGDWILKFSEADLNCYPWATSKDYYNFELTPWRRSQYVDGPEVMAAPIPQWDTETENRILSKLHRKSQNLVKKKDSFRKFKNSALVIEEAARLKQSKSDKIPRRQFTRTPTNCDNFRDNVLKSDQMPRHWGYFSQRNSQLLHLVNKYKNSSMNDYKKLSQKKKINTTKAIVTYCFIDNGKHAQFLCSNW